MKNFTLTKLSKFNVVIILLFLMVTMAEAQTYTKVTKVEDLKDGYFIVFCNDYAMNGHTYVGEENWYSMYEDQDGVLGANKLTLENGKEVHGDFIWHIFNSEKDRYTIGRNGLYLKTNYNKSKGASDKDIEVGDDFTKNKQQWDVTYANEKWIFRSHDEETNDRYLMFNESKSGLNRFAAYDDPDEEEKLHPTAIYKVDDPTLGMIQTIMDNKKVYYYDLTGRRVLHPKRGIYITNKGKKVYIK